MAVKNCFIRGSVVRYVEIPASAVDTQLLEDATRRGQQRTGLADTDAQCQNRGCESIEKVVPISVYRTLFVLISPPPAMSNNVPLAELESKLGSLTELAGRFDKIRSAPSSLLQPVQYDHLRDLGGLYDPTARLKTAFADSSSFANALTSAEVQDALLFAENSNNADPSGVDVSAWRREKGPARSVRLASSPLCSLLAARPLR